MGEFWIEINNHRMTYFPKYALWWYSVSEREREREREKVVEIWD